MGERDQLTDQIRSILKGSDQLTRKGPVDWEGTNWRGEKDQSGQISIEGFRPILDQLTQRGPVNLGRGAS